MIRKLPALIAVAAAISFGLAACGDDESTSTTAAGGDTTSSTESTTESSTTASGGGGETVSLTETEFKIDPSEVTVPAGTVTFDISNDGSQVHNLEIEGDGVEEISDDLQGGQSGQLTVDLPAGTYEMYCAIDGHKDLGMEGEVTAQ